MEYIYAKKQTFTYALAIGLRTDLHNKLRLQLDNALHCYFPKNVL